MEVVEETAGDCRLFLAKVFLGCQGVIGLSKLSKFLLSFGGAVNFWVVFESLLSVGLFDFLLSSFLAHSQNFMGCGLFLLLWIVLVKELLFLFVELSLGEEIIEYFLR